MDKDPQSGLILLLHHVVWLAAKDLWKRGNYQSVHFLVNKINKGHTRKAENTQEKGMKI